MKYHKSLKQNLILAILFLLIIIVGICSYLSPTTFSNFSVVENIWSGEIATSFDGGNGTEDNPYQISRGEELAYFKTVIEGENSSQYKDKYYILTNNINLGNLVFDPIGNEDNIFSGTFDGQGYTISNVIINQTVSINDNLYIGLFAKTEDAIIKNINLNNLKIINKENNNFYIGVIAGEINNTDISNISLKESTITIEEKENRENIYIGSIAGRETSSKLSNMYINTEITAGQNPKAGSILGYTDKNNISNILVVSNIEDYSSNQKENKNIYTNESVPSNFLEKLNKDLNENYYWVYENNIYYLYKEEIILYTESINMRDATASIETHDSGVDTASKTVYVNDLDSDYNYYMGLNYTSSSDSKLPTTSSKNIYSDENLVNVQITYNGSSTSNGITVTGTVSTTETENKYIYYKVYPVNNNGTDSKTDDYIKIELIDNPFTNRPNGYAFNGWYTDYFGAKISIDDTIYTRYVEIPITYSDNKPDDIVITFNARWTSADVSYIETNSSNALTNAISSFNDFGLQELETRVEHRIETPIYGDIYDIDMSGYYTHTTVSRWSTYPSNSYDSNGNRLSGLCFTNGGCEAYVLVNGSLYDDSQTYYELTSNGMQVLDVSTLEAPIIDYDVTITYTDLLSSSDNMSTYFEKVTITRGNSYAGYYNASGVYQTSGTCNTTAGCTYYKLIQYYDDNGNANNYDSSKTYYYLVTRDTNIIVLKTNINNSWGTSQTKPLTITGSYGGIDYDVTWNVSGTAVRANDDLVIDNMTINAAQNASETTPGSSNTTSRYFYGNWNNVKIGRGISQSGSYVNFSVAMGGNNSATGSSSNITKYRFVIESGHYSSLSLTGGSSNITAYINGEGIYGNDYDRVKNNNDNLDVYFCASGSWGSNVYQSGITSIALHTKVKSGKFGSARPTTIPNSNTSNYSYGIYVGGRNSGANYTAREAVIEGGWVYNLIGGPLAQSSNASYNDSYIYVKGGEVDVIIGGAGRTETYGNRIIQVTDGTINYSIFGGSNGITSSTSGTQTGTLTGTPYIYIGGKAQIGNADYVSENETLFGFEAGSVFGIGNGQSGTSTIGTADNSYIIIDGEATILRNVYGGGNYGAVGINSSSSTSTTEIKILGGTIKGSVFGGGNKNGSGSTSKTASITINQLGGTIEGSIYGGANEEGTIYGSVNINSLGGNVLNDIYGGGYGGQSNTTTGTYVRDAITINVGDTTDDIVPTIEGSVYGGSAFGTINGTTNSTAISSSGVNVIVNEGIIKNAVFGGAKGNSTYTPYVLGNIVVTINGGNIADVFGGNNAAGTPNGSITIYLNGGTIGRTFGGGNQASVNTNTIYLQGGTSENIFGGSNEAGTVTTSNIITTSGQVDIIYGGNNTAGNTVTSNITINGGNILTAVYGGGNLATTDTTNVTLNASIIPNVYGGGANADITTKTNVTLNGSIIGNIYGGSNAGGTVAESSVILKNGIVANVFGGNNLTGTTTITNINTQGGNIGNIYGGGNQAGVTTSNITLDNGYIDNVYGGSNQKGNVESTNIINGSSPSNATTEAPLTMEISHNQEWDQQPYTSTSRLKIKIINNTNVEIVRWNATIITTDSSLFNNWSSTEIENHNNIYTFNEVNRYYGTNTISSGGNISLEFLTGNYTSYEEFAVLLYDIVGYDSSGNEYKINTSNSLSVGELYGGNNLGGTTTTPTISLEKGYYNNVYGGGNQAITSGTPTININGANINESLYGGGNQASVLENTIVNISGTTNVKNNVFGGGNHGSIGESTTDNSVSTVNIAGATIGGNIYGGCNTSVVYGTTSVNIGSSAIADSTNMTNDNIIISGTVFGGGEANESGSEDYDFSFISVTKGIDVNINGTNYESNNLEFTISGSIFGSGNASSSAGPSNIYIKKLGTRKNPNTSISIQRADQVTIDDSTIELIGTTDRTNEYSSIKYSLNRIKVLKIKNNASLLLRENANMLESFYSLVDIDGEEVKATVTIDDDSKTVTKNVDNRLYMLANKNLNVTTNETATSYGVVSGMTFLGMYETYASGSYVYGMYDEKMSYGSTASASDVITGGSYVLGLHNINHDITIDGFYTNYIDDEYTILTTAYVEPTPQDANYYMWTIGTASISYSFNLTASKYSSLGTYELSMKDFSDGNTTFNVIGFNADGLKEGVVIKDSSEVPKLAATQEEANSIIGLAMKTETTEWTNNSTTKFYDPDNDYDGTLTYKTDNQKVAPSLMFYLYHAKNISADQELGTVVIRLQALIPKNEIEYESKLITIYATIDTKYYDDADSYDASITYNKKYEMPSATNVNITNKSQFTAYFALFAETDDDNELEFYGINNDYYHALVSNYVLPVGTKITMIDYGVDDVNPKYYYYVITEEIYQTKLAEFNSESEVIYRLSDFIKMDSIDSNNNYIDSVNNNIYIHEDINYVMEEFIFIFDFKDTEDIGEKLDNTILFELRNSEDRTILSVLGIRQNLMHYNLYESSNVVLSETITMDTNYLYYNKPKETTYRTSIGYDQTELRESIINTNYESSSMGINITFYDSAGTQVSSSLLSSTTININGTTYYVDGNGIFRIKLADKVSNLTESMTINTGVSLPTGNYIMRIALFASNDGLHNSSDKEATIEEIEITVVGDDNLIIVNTEDESKLIIGETGLNMNDSKEEKFTITYSSVLENPNIRIAVYKRSTTSSITNEYIEYNAKDLFSNSFSYPSSPYIKQSTYEYMVTNNPSNTITLSYGLKDNLKSGTYKIIFRLYDENQIVDEDYKYIIIRKNI